MYVSEFFPPIIHGGGEISAYSLAREMAKDNEVHVLTSSFKGLKRDEIKEGIHIHRRFSTGKDPGRTIDNIKRMILFEWSSNPAKIINSLDANLNFDVIHLLNMTSLAFSPKLRKKGKVVTINSYLPLCPKGNLFFEEKKICSGCSPKKYIRCMRKSTYAGKMKIGRINRWNPFFLSLLYIRYKRLNNALPDANIIALSDFILDKIPNKGKGSKNKAYNIFYPDEKIIKLKGIEERIRGKKVIGSFSALEKIKGIDLLINGFSQCDNKDTVLLIAGEGSMRDKLEELAVGLKIEDRVIFTGKADYKHIPYLYSICDIVVLTTQWPEPFSRILMESAYHGKPLLATNSGGNPEGLVDGKNGTIIKNDAKDIAKKMDVLLKEDKLRDRMGKEAKKLFIERFDKDKVVEKIKNIYRHNSISE